MLACETDNQVESGRWLTPDPLGGDITNPRSLNRYAYALNNPTTFTDPMGLDACTPGAQCVTVYGGTPPDIGLIFWQDLRTLCYASGYECGYNGGYGSPYSYSGGGGGGSAPAPKPAPPNSGKTIKCSGSARVLQGNAATIGKPGGFSGPSVGNIPVTANGAAVIPSQWGGKAALRPFLNQISGVFPSVNYSFMGVVDVMGGAPPAGFPANSNVQTDLMQLNPGKLILELPGAPQDFGTTGVTITSPSAAGCPAGTVQVP